jgi:transposase
MVNPRQARSLAERTGTLAKTDRVDASMLAQMGSLLELKADEPAREIVRDLKDMETAIRTDETLSPKVDILISIPPLAHAGML